MPEIGPEHPLTYRQEIAEPIFQLIRSGESVAVVGLASMGKSRLLRFVLRPDVQAHYLGDASPATWLVRVDGNRLATVSEWGLYELLLTALIEAASGQLEAGVVDWLGGLRREVILSENALLARRYVELATQVLCRQQPLRLCLVCDEFDECYRSLPASSLHNLRFLRDADRYSLCYLLLLRDHPARLRSPDDHEGFYELFSRSILGLKPYMLADGRRVLAQLAVRRRFPLTAQQEELLLHLSGAHPGLMVVLFDRFLRAKEGDPVEGPAEEVVRWALAQEPVSEECRRVWNGLGQDEQLALSRLVQGGGVPPALRELLLLKGLLQEVEGGRTVFGSPLLREYVRTQASIDGDSFRLDEPSAALWVEGRRVSDLTRLEFELLRYLYRRRGQVCSREEILGALYPDERIEAIGGDNRVDSLMRHLRRAVEPVPEQPRYLLTVRGHGYRLVDKPEPTR